MTTNKTLAFLPSLPTTSKQRPMRPCACGCSRPTQRTFAPGHDARLKGLILRQIGGVMTNEEIAAWGGKDTAAAVTNALKDKALMKRWNIVIEAAPVEQAG